MRREALLERFRAVVAARPSSHAVSDVERVLDYAALARASERVAAAIRAFAGGPGGRVLLLCEHRLEAIVGLLGALEAGQAIVPLPPHEDDGVLAGFARDAAACALIADRAAADRARALARALACACEGGAASPAERDGSSAAASSADRNGSSAAVEVSLGLGSESAHDEGLVVIGLAPDAGRALADECFGELLAILYTSGTTAQPKGVMTSAASVLERALQYLEASGLPAGERQAAITAWHFAASLPEVWGALLAGAELCLYDARRRGIEGLPEWLRDRSVGWLQLPVAMARRLLPELAPGALTSVRFASISGDRLRRSEAVALLEAMAPGAMLLHTYGSTETNLIAQLPLQLPDRDWPAESEAGYLAVGRPVPGKRVHVLDERLAPVAPGATGRIAVEGALLSPGYWRQPALTAERFRRAASGDPLFVSGDFGRLRADGCLELAGRDAGQAKIRGMRVDLVAIEAELLALEGVAGAAVGLQPACAGPGVHASAEAHAGGGVHAGGEAHPGGGAATEDGPVAGRARDEGDEDVRLVAWIEPRSGYSVDTTRLRRALQGRLPAHWIPARFVFVEALPWTANGKLDRRRLPDPGSARPRLGVGYAPPRDETEAWVCGIWARLFALDAVGRDDDFFDLGGDSLRLLELFTTIERATGRPLALADLAGLPTPARVAELLRRVADEAEAEADLGGRDDGRGRRDDLRDDGDGARGGSAASDDALRFLGVQSASDATGPLPRRLRRALKQSLRHPLRGAGPILLGRPLPYAAGFAVQRRLARVLAPLPPFRGRLRVVDAWHARLGLDSDPAQARLRSFLANTWGEWRLRALEDPIALERVVAIEGLAELEDLADRGRGLVLVVSHVYWNALLARLPALSKRPFTLIRQPKGDRFGGGEDAVGTARAEQLQRAARVLARGGVALIAGDAGRGQAAVEIPFHGVLRRFRPGAATLAETTGAVLAPVFSRLELDGRIVFRFETPLASDAASPEARIRDCTERYAALYAERWPRIFDSLAWKNVRRALDPPQDW